MILNQTERSGSRASATTGHADERKSLVLDMQVIFRTWLAVHAGDGPLMHEYQRGERRAVAAGRRAQPCSRADPQRLRPGAAQACPIEKATSAAEPRCREITNPRAD